MIVNKRSIQALLVVDVQNDFCAGGTLAVPGAEAIITVLNAYMDLFIKRAEPIFASRDWHPRQSSHFKDWPAHCIQHTSGAQFHPDLRLPPDAHILSKGMHPDEDAYSAFQALDERGRQLGQLLQLKGIRELYVGGLATDYCVKATVCDALQKGYAVILLLDAIRAVDSRPGAAEAAVQEMQRHGAQTITLNHFS
jgi:nicotinamidase/pyrazinamidase